MSNTFAVFVFLLLGTNAVFVRADVTRDNPPLYWGLTDHASQSLEVGRYPKGTGDLWTQDQMKAAAYRKFRDGWGKDVRRELGDAFAEVAQRTTITPPDSPFQTVWRFNPERTRTRRGVTTIHQTLRVRQRVLLISDRRSPLTPHALYARIAVLGPERRALEILPVTPADFSLVQTEGGRELQVADHLKPVIRSAVADFQNEVEAVALRFTTENGPVGVRTITPARARAYLGWPPELPPGAKVVYLPTFATPCEQALHARAERWPFEFE